MGVGWVVFKKPRKRLEPKGLGKGCGGVRWGKGDWGCVGLSTVKWKNVDWEFFSLPWHSP